MKKKKRIESILYSDYTWSELKEMVRENRVVVLPVGSVEDHGPHLPRHRQSFCLGDLRGCSRENSG